MWTARKPSEGFGYFVTSIPASAASAGAVAGWALHPLESAACPRRTPEADEAANRRFSSTRDVTTCLRVDDRTQRLPSLSINVNFRLPTSCGNGRLDAESADTALLWS
jgi:hypothetical protein